MARNTVGRLRVQLFTETAEFKKGLASARTNIQSFDKSVQRLTRTLAFKVASIGAVTAAFRAGIQQLNEYESAQRTLAATAAIGGYNLDYLTGIVQESQKQFALSAQTATKFTTELGWLTDKAGDIRQTSAALEAFLDIGAARGLQATETLQRLEQVLMGTTEGYKALFDTTRAELLDRFAASLGTTAARLTETQKAQAILNEAMTDGAAVRGEYQRWLTTAQGRQHLLNNSIEQTQLALGRALQPALIAVLPLMQRLAEWTERGIKGFQLIAGSIKLVGPAIGIAKASIVGGMDEAQHAWRMARNEFRLLVQDLNGITIKGLSTGPLSFGTPDEAAGEGTKAARAYFGGLQDEWERLRHEVAGKSLIFGTPIDRLRLEEDHALRMLDIQEREERARHRLGELTDDELKNSLEELNIRRQIAQERRSQLEVAERMGADRLFALEREQLLTEHAVSTERMRNEFLVRRLATEGSIEDRLQSQLDSLHRTHELQRRAITEDLRLSEDARLLELQRLDLQRQRSEEQLRLNAALEEENRKRERQRGIVGELDRMLSGSFSGAALGSSIGSALGSFVPAFGTAIGALGARIGSLFDQGQDSPQVRGLRALERAQRDTITAISKQTQDLLSPERQLLNAPSNFNIPRHLPGPNGTTTNYGAVNVHLTINHSGPLLDPETIGEEVIAAITGRLTRQSQTGHRYALR